MSVIEEKLDFLISEISLIKKALNIVPDKFITINDIDDSVNHYIKFA